MGCWKLCQCSCQVLDSSNSSSAVVKDLLDTSRHRPEHNLDYDLSSRQTTTITSSPLFEASEPPSPLIISEPPSGVGHQDEEKPQPQQETRDRTSDSLRPEDIFQERTTTTKEQQALQEDNIDGASLNDSIHSLTSSRQSRSNSRKQQQQQHEHPSIITIEEPTADSRIQFGKIHIREFPMTVGDSPSTTRGVPITMDWNPRAEYDLCLNDFEDIRPTLLRRTVAELQMSSLDRLRLLKAEGWSGRELQQHYVQENSKKRQGRRRHERSWNNQWDWYQERLVRGVRNATLSQRRKQRERDWIQFWQQQDQKRVTKSNNTKTPSSILKITTGARS